MESKVSDRLFDRVCQGKFAAAEAQRLACDTVSDYGVGGPPLVDAWASLGASGKHRGNVHSGSFTWARSFGVQIRACAGSDGRSKPERPRGRPDPTSPLCPREVLASAWGAGRDVFQYMFTGPNGGAGALEFWGRQGGRERVRERPGFQRGA
eukprot:6253667-Pyramimonas_sp.AAC.1